MRLYDRGIRRRLAPMLGSRPRLELANSVMLALPGTPVLRYGDEIGMGEDLTLDERDAVRTPMQWSCDANGGFSAAEDPAALVQPVIAEGPYAYEAINVEAQLRERDSLLNWTKRMLLLRKERPEIGYGEWEILETGEPHTLAVTYVHLGTRVVTLHNFAERAVTVRFALPGAGGADLVDLTEPFETGPQRGEEEYELRLGAYGYRWFRLRGTNPVMR